MDVIAVEKVREEQAYTLGTAAYLWGFTMNELYRVRSVHLAKSGNAVNRFDHLRVLMTPELARKVGVVRANSATLYSAAWLDLSVEPIVLEFPAIADRYFTFNYVDYFQNNENLSNVTIGGAGGAYAFVGPHWKGALPDKIRRVNVGTDTVWIIGRTEVKGPDDVKNVNALQDRYSLTSLREWVAGQRNTTGENVYPQWPAYDVSNPLNFFMLLNEGLRHNPPQAARSRHPGPVRDFEHRPQQGVRPRKARRGDGCRTQPGVGDRAGDICPRTPRRGSANSSTAGKLRPN